MANQVYGFDSEASFQRVRAATLRSENDVGTNRVPRARGPVFLPETATAVGPFNWFAMTTDGVLIHGNINGGSTATGSPYFPADIYPGGDYVFTGNASTGAGGGAPSDAFIRYAGSNGYIQAYFKVPAGCKALRADATHFYAAYGGLVGKFTHDGTLVWSKTSSPYGLGNHYALDIDDAGNVYGELNVGPGFENLRVWDSAGSTVCSATLTTGSAQGALGVAAANDGTGAFYAVSASTLEKFNASGVSVWERAFTGQPWSVAHDPVSGNTLVGGKNGTSPRLWLVDSSGVVTWTKTPTAPSGSAFEGVAFDASGNCYACGSAWWETTSLRSHYTHLAKYDVAGTLVWAYDHGNTLNNVHVVSGVVYACGSLGLGIRGGAVSL